MLQFVITAIREKDRMAEKHANCIDGALYVMRLCPNQEKKV